jgi:hypothetical protein
LDGAGALQVLLRKKRERKTDPVDINSRTLTREIVRRLRQV